MGGFGSAGGFMYGLPSIVSNASFNSGSFSVEKQASQAAPEQKIIPELSMGDLLDDAIDEKDGTGKGDNDGKMEHRPTPLTELSVSIREAVDSLSISSGDDQAGEAEHDDIEENRSSKELEKCPSQKLEK